MAPYSVPVLSDLLSAPTARALRDYGVACASDDQTVRKVLYDLADKTLANTAEVLEANRAELRESIDNVVRDLREIVESGSLSGAALRDRIDTKLHPDLIRFADARESMVHLFGLQAYADIMSHFAAGERYINRVWSSSADGYDVEAARYLGKAEEQFADAQRQLNEAARR